MGLVLQLVNHWLSDSDDQ
ncbi:hypothetical protein [Enterococcus alishanensis]